MDNLMITLDHLEYFYDNNKALSIDKLSITKGITSVILGSNGSGKTTALKILSGLLTPSNGSININIEELKSNAILVHQIPYMFSGTVKYNMEFVLKNKKIAAHKRTIIIKDVLEKANLLHLIHRKTSQLSGGEKHRLAIARAIAVEPENLILDEPFAHIDTESRELIEDLILQRAKNHKTTLFSTHDLSSAYRLADRIIYLENGNIKEPEYNFLKGSVSLRGNHFCSFLVKHNNKEMTILSPASDANHRAVVIPYRDIFLSKDRIESSAQNQIAGKIIALEKSGSQFLVSIDCGIELKAVITDLSVEKLQLKEKKMIFVNFKASAVKLY